MDLISLHIKLILILTCYFPIPFPDNLLLEHAEGLDKLLSLGLAHRAGGDGGPEGDVDHTFWRIIQELLYIMYIV